MHVGLDVPSQIFKIFKAIPSDNVDGAPGVDQNHLNKGTHQPLV